MSETAPKHPRRRRAARIAAVAVVLFCGLALVFGRRWDNPGPDLRGLSDDGADVVLHVANTARPWHREADGWWARVAADDEVGRRWPALFAATDDQAAALEAALRALSPQDSRLARALHGELLVMANLAEPEAGRVGGTLWGGDPRAPFPFADLAVVLRPDDRRAMVALRTALRPWWFDRFVRDRLPAGARIDDGVLILDDVAALLGPELFRDREPPPRLVIACGAERIVAGTDPERVRALVTAAPAAVPGAAPPLSARLDAAVRARLAEATGSRIAAGVPEALRALAGLPVEGEITLTLDEDGGAAVLEARWKDPGLTLTTAVVERPGEIVLVAAGGGDLAGRLLAATTERSWFDEAARSSLAVADGPLALRLLASTSGTAPVGLEPAETSEGARPAHRRFHAEGRTLAAWLETTAAARLDRAVTPPAWMLESERERIAEDLALATAESELDPADFERLVENRHLEWTAEWERLGLESHGIALGKLLRAVFAVTGPVRGEIVVEAEEAVMRWTLAPR